MSAEPELLNLEVEAEHAGQRLDVFLSHSVPELSRSRAGRVASAGLVSVNGRPSKPAVRLQEGDVVSLDSTLPSRPPPTLSPELHELSVIYEDEDLAVICKPAGMVVHPAAGHASGTLVHALLARYPELREENSERPGIVHRLDKDTSGLMLVARNPTARLYLQEELRQRRVLKEYTLLCCGRLDPSSGTVEAPIGRHPADRLRMAVVSTGR
ncbi:MAG: RluA family pseudouridine synthase, partial [Chloroflexota bacterium]|nr:RluA family pseudouridine synthase [Chloroflexota bacterium]